MMGHDGADRRISDDVSVNPVLYYQKQASVRGGRETCPGLFSIIKWACFQLTETVGLVFKAVDLAGEGVIGRVAVRCLSPEMQMVCHTGYDLPDAQLRDVALLHERFGV